MVLLFFLGGIAGLGSALPQAAPAGGSAAGSTAGGAPDAGAPDAGAPDAGTTAGSQSGAGGTLSLSSLLRLAIHAAIPALGAAVSPRGDPAAATTGTANRVTAADRGWESRLADVLDGVAWVLSGVRLTSPRSLTRSCLPVIAGLLGPEGAAAGGGGASSGAPHSSPAGNAATAPQGAAPAAGSPAPGVATGPAAASSGAAPATGATGATGAGGSAPASSPAAAGAGQDPAAAIAAALGVAPGVPVIAIYHSHAREAYRSAGGGGGDRATSADAVHSDDLSRTVVAAGEELAACLWDSFGIRAIHSEVVHDKNGRIGSYVESKNTVTGLIGEQRALRMFLDLHRDALGRDDTTVVFAGQPVARLMVVLGTDNPNWRKNYALAQRLLQRLEANCPGISRGILTKSDNYNQELAAGALLLEVGGPENTLDEVRRTMRFLAAALAAMALAKEFPAPPG